MSGLVDKCLQDCTPHQREAITHVEGPLLILAGAGSGKTRVITRRLACLVAQGVRPGNILALTFTNKAANEMQERVLQMGVKKGAWVATFHSTCARLLRMYGDKLGFTPDYTIYDAADSVSTVKEAMKDFQVDPREHKPASVAGIISYAKNSLTSPQELYGQGEKGKMAAEVFVRYSDLLKARNAMDFDDLLLNALALLRKHQDVRERLQSRFRFIMVDEYQDTNRVQYLIAKHLAEATRNLCATGDPDQSIYAWRGADIQNILDFEKDYGDALVVRLERNYRSTQRILLAASGVIRHNVARKEKELWTENPEGSHVRIVQCSDEDDEGVTVAQEIRRIVGKGGVDYGGFAVFYRTNAQSRSVETALAALGIPHIVVQGVAFYQRREIKDLMAHLRLLVNPADAVSLARVVSAPPTGIGGTSLSRLRSFAEKAGVPVCEVLRSPKEAALRGKAAFAAEKLYQRLARLTPLLSAGPHQTLLAVVEETKFFEHLRGLDNPEDRVANVQELLDSAQRYERDNPDGGVTGFLEMAALVSDQDRYDSESGAVSLMTLHCAKGLEFDHVYMVGLEEGLLPLMRQGEVEDLEEERRLCFVGMTRARKELALLFAEERTRYGKTDYQKASRFLSEIPDEALERPFSAEPAFAAGPAYHPDFRQFPSPPRPGPAKQPRPKKAERTAPFQKGDTVRHPKFGQGMVVEADGMGPQGRVTVKFREAGTKTLVLEYANLTKG